MYLSIILDRTLGGLQIVASEKGGINIEDGDPSQIKNFALELPASVDDVPEDIYEKVG